MTGFRLVGKSTSPYRSLYLGSPADVAGMDSMEPFVAFTALDATALTDEQLGALARSLIGGGCVYACSWGPEADRVETAFDWEVVRSEMEQSARALDIMTTSHEDESLDEAIWFALFVAFPPEIEASAVVAIADFRWHGEIEARLSGPEDLRRV